MWPTSASPSSSSASRWSIASRKKKTSRWRRAKTVTVAGYTFTFNGVKAVQGAELPGLAGRFRSCGQRQIPAQDEPGKAQLPLLAMPMTEAAIDAGLVRDVYVSLGEPIDRDKPEAEWAVRASITNPSSTGSGAAVRADGARRPARMLDRRYRVKSRSSAPITTPAGSQHA
jgi:cytochrome c-type biogenesis protein CcmF